MNTLKIFFQPSNFKMLFFGFSSGLPILLVFSTLSVWLFKAGISRSTVTLFSWAGFAYAFKYLWSPIVDNFKIPFLQKMGHRRSWLFLAQLMIVFSLIATSLTDPAQNLVYTALTITSLAIFSATQDIVIDAYRIESAPQKLQGSLSSLYIAGYRLAMLVGGAGSLWLASSLSGEIYDKLVWRIVYLSMALLMGIGIITTILSEEPKIIKKKFLSMTQHTKFLFVFVLALLGFFFLYNFIQNPFNNNEVVYKFIFSTSRIFLCFIFSSLIIYLFVKINFVSREQTKKIYFEPINNFTKRYGKFAFYILLLISLYRIADVVMGVVANIFYLEKGFDIKEIATYSKFFGVFATNILFLITVITADNISSGFAGAAFVVYLSGLTSIKFTATQYALFSSIMLFFPKLIAGYAGSWVDVMGYANFFTITALLGVPVLLLIIWISKIAPVKN